MGQHYQQSTMRGEIVETLHIHADREIFVLICVHQDTIMIYVK